MFLITLSGSLFFSVCIILYLKLFWAKLWLVLGIHVCNLFRLRVLYPGISEFASHVKELNIAVVAC